MKTTTLAPAHLAAACAAVLACACSRSEPENFFRVSDAEQAHAPSSAEEEATPVDIEEVTVAEAPVEAEAAPTVVYDPGAADGATGPGREAALRYMSAGGARPANPDARPATVAGAPPARERPTADAADAPPSTAREANATARAGREPARPVDPVRADAEPRAAAVARDPDQSRSLNQQAIGLIAAGRHEAAIPLLERALELQPRDAEMLGNLGYAYMLAGDHRAARARFIRSLDLAPTRSATWLNLGQTYAEMGQRDVAVDAVLKGYRYSTRKPSVRSALQRAATGRQFDPTWREAAGIALERIGSDGRS